MVILVFKSIALFLNIYLFPHLAVLSRITRKNLIISLRWRLTILWKMKRCPLSIGGHFLPSNIIMVVINGCHKRKNLQLNQYKKLTF